MNDTIKTLLIIGVLMGIIQIILIMSVVHVSAKSDEIAEYLSSINEKLQRIAGYCYKPSDIQIESQGTSSAAPKVKNVGNTWTCPDCGTENPLTSRICKDCGREK